MPNQSACCSHVFLEVNKEFVPVGEYVDPDTLFALSVVYLLSPSYDIEKSYYEGNELIVELKNKIKVLFPVPSDRDYLLGSFFLVYNELIKQYQNSTIEKNGMTTIDLRFKNPVIRDNI